MRTPLKITLGASLLFAATVHAAPLYTVTDLAAFSLPNYPDSIGYAINDLGQVAGDASNPTGNDVPFLFSNGTTTNIDPSASNFNHDFGINNVGQIIFRSSNTPFLYSNGTVTPVSSLPGWTSNALAGPINNLGQIGGRMNISGNTYDAFIYSNGVIHDLGHPRSGFEAFVNAMNDAGQLAGSVDGRAFLYANNTFTVLGTLDPAGPPDTGFSTAYAINKFGEIAGVSTAPDGLEHVFVYANNTMSGFGTLGNGLLLVNAMNDSDEIVGYFYPADASGVPDAGASIGFVDINGTLTNLNTLIDPSLGLNIRRAYGINNLGQITGFATLPDGDVHAFILTPTPEPTSLLFLALALPLLPKRRAA